MNKSTNTDRLVRIETKLCKFTETQTQEVNHVKNQLAKVAKQLAAQERENARLKKFLDQWDEYQRQVREGSLTD